MNGISLIILPPDFFEGVPITRNSKRIRMTGRETVKVLVNIAKIQEKSERR